MVNDAQDFMLVGSGRSVSAPGGLADILTDVTAVVDKFNGGCDMVILAVPRGDGEAILSGLMAAATTEGFQVEFETRADG